MTSREPGWDLAFAKAKRARDLLGAFALGAFALGLGLTLWLLLRGGFSHVSDDDFARTVIAQEWVASVRGYRFLHELPPFRQARWVRVVDPSGTSWLPFPFWITGASMALFGRSIEVARATQMVLLAGATILLARTLRRVAFGRLAAACILAIGFANPYVLWAAASQTPDAWVSLLIAVGLLALAEKQADPIAALSLLAASLSRYEAWPVVAVFAVRYLVARPATPRVRLVAFVPALGPAFWMVWNAVAHGSALHFFTRVSRYRHAHDALPVAARAAFVPQATLELFGSGLAIVLVVAVCAILARSDARRRWRSPLLGAAALVTFLVAGSLADGAPTHHPARAQLSLSWLGAAVLMLGTVAAMQRVQARAGSKAGATLVAALGFVGIVWIASLPSRIRDFPGRGDDDRTGQIERGQKLAAGPEGPIHLVPCRYEHLALLAAFAAPERVIVESGTNVSGECPQVR